MTKKILFLVRKIFLLVIILSLVFVSSPTPLLAYVQYRAYNTQGQKHAGGFYTLDGSGGGFLGRPFVGGGTVFIDWRDLEPREGEYHWELLDEVLYQPWKDYNDCYYQKYIYCPIHPTETDCQNLPPNCNNPSPQRSPGHDFSAVNNAAKTARFKLHITDGAVPLWLFGGQGLKEGLSTSSYGYICAYKTYEQVWNKTPDCKGNSDQQNYMNNDIVISQPYPPYPGYELAVHPVWWNEKFHEKFKKFLFLLGQKIASDPKYYNAIEFVEASVGNFGEMILYGKGDYVYPPSPTPPYFDFDSVGVRMWKAAGYTNARYAEAVLKILGYYIDAFPALPVALSLGSGLYPGGLFDDGSGVISLRTEVTTKAMEKWGARLYLKFAGFGGGQEQLFKLYCPQQTKCIYESFGTITAWKVDGLPWDTWKNMPEKFAKALKVAVDDHAYIAMMWSSDWRVISDHDTVAPDSQDLIPVLEDYGYKLGPQIRMRDGNNGVVFDSQTIHAGSILKITTKWINDTTWVSLWRPKRIFNFATQTYKEIPYSYPLYFDLVDASGNVVFKTSYMPQKGTETWAIPAGNIDSEDQIFIPWNIPPGQYTPRVGIVLNDEMTKFFNIGGRDTSESPPYPIVTKKITVTAPTTSTMSLKKGWNKIVWPVDIQSSRVMLAQIWSVCPFASRRTINETFVGGYTFLPDSFGSGDEIFFSCKQSLW